MQWFCSYNEIGSEKQNSHNEYLIEMMKQNRSSDYILQWWNKTDKKDYIVQWWNRTDQINIYTDRNKSDQTNVIWNDETAQSKRI